jgi:hypothetical protein
MLFDGTNARLDASATIETAPCGDHTHVRVTLQLDYLSDREVDSAMRRWTDRVGGCEIIVAHRNAVSGGVKFVFRPTLGNRSVAEVRRILREIAAALNLNITVDETINTSLIVEDVWSTLTAGLARLSGPYALRSGFGRWDIP